MSSKHIAIVRGRNAGLVVGNEIQRRPSVPSPTGNLQVRTLPVRCYRAQAAPGWRQKRSRKRLVVLNLAEVDAVDAAGLGLLVFLYTSAAIGGMELKLMNPTQRTWKLLALTNLDSVLEIWSPQHVEWLPSGAEHAHAAEVEPNLHSSYIGTCRPFQLDDGLPGSNC
jgi:anti-anti-sigma factor